MKVSAKGKENLHEAAKNYLNSGVPPEAMPFVITSWVVGLLENQTPELVACLTEDSEESPG